MLVASAYADVTTRKPEEHPKCNFTSVKDNKEVSGCMEKEKCKESEAGDLYYGQCNETSKDADSCKYCGANSFAALGKEGKCVYTCRKQWYCVNDKVDAAKLKTGLTDLAGQNKESKEKFTKVAETCTNEAKSASDPCFEAHKCIIRNVMEVCGFCGKDAKKGGADKKPSTPKPSTQKPKA